MADHKYHHYVPRFYLNEWTTKGKLSRFQWMRGRLEVLEKATKRIAGSNYLYSLKHRADDPQFYEREVMGKQIDATAADVYYHMNRSKTPLRLTQTQREIWTRFLMSLRVRMPNVIDRLRADVPHQLRQSLLTQCDEYDMLRTASDPLTPYEFMELHQPGYIADSGIHILSELLTNPSTFQRIIEMEWRIKHLNESTVDLLTSDRPLIIVPSIDDATCIMALPLNPRLAFFAASNLPLANKIMSEPASRLARRLNHETVKLADQCVFATNRNQEAFIKKNFVRKN